MKNKIKITVVGLLGLGLVACSSFYNQAMNTRATAVDLAYGAYQGWTNYYCTQTNLATTTAQQRTNLDNAESTVKEARLKFAASVGTFDGWIMAYQTNSVAETQAQAALDATVQNASNVVWLVHYFSGK